MKYNIINAVYTRFNSKNQNRLHSTSNMPAVAFAIIIRKTTLTVIAYLDV